MDVSLLISVHNRLDMTSACLESLWRTLPAGSKAEVLIYDDQSTDETPAYLAGLAGRVKVVREDDRGYFGRNMNRLAREASGRWLCLLNNDTLLSPDWLSALLDFGEKHPKAAVIGNFHRFPHTRRINHAGIVFDRSLNPRHLYLGMPDSLGCTRAARQFQCVSGACWLAPRERFLALGGFDLNYRNGCDDLDFCMRSAEAGYETWYCGASRIEHFGQSTPGRMDFEEENHRRFFCRWKDRLIPDLGSYVAEDGQIWPPGSPTYRLAYWLWRRMPTRLFRTPLLQSRVGTRLRQRMLSFLTR